MASKSGPKGFLLVLMQPPPAFEDEFNAWYDSEHIPERLAVPGVLTGLRFVCISGHPRYLAMYDLERHEVLESPAYLKVAFDQSSPWTKRVTGRVRVWRSSGHQVYPGGAITGRCARVELIRFRGCAKGAEADIVAGARKVFEGRPETSQVRVLAYDTGAAGTDLMVLVEQRAPRDGALDLSPFGAFAERIDMTNVYAPY